MLLIIPDFDHILQWVLLLLIMSLQYAEEVDLYMCEVDETAIGSCGEETFNYDRDLCICSFSIVNQRYFEKVQSKVWWHRWVSSVIFKSRFVV